MDELWSKYESVMVDSLSQGWPETEKDTLDPALRLVLSFATWHTLAQTGLDAAGSARLASRMVQGAIGR